MEIKYNVILNLLGSLGIFLFAIEFLSSNLKKLSLDSLKRWLLRSSKTPVRGIITGTAATALLSSSSVVIILLIAFVDSHLISFANALGIVLGANIGTTISSQVIAFNVGDYASIPLFIGIMGSVLAKSEKVKLYWNVLTGISLVFFSLHLMDLSVAPYKDSPAVRGWMARLTDPLSGILVGGLATLLIQSSSATVGIAIVLASQGVIGLDAGIAIMLGSEIGTCSDTLLATIGRSREAVRIGVFHTAYNIFAVFLGWLTFDWLKAFVLWSASGASLARQIANAHVFFNLGGALVFLCFIPLIREGLLRALPEKKPNPISTVGI